MEYRTFGSTDIKISTLGLGCWDASVSQAEPGDGYGDLMGAAIDRAVDMGINCFDTSPAYGMGKSERTLAKALGPRRKDVVLVTKCGSGGMYKDRPRGRDGRRESVLALVEGSMQTLQTDYIDVLLLQHPDTTTPFEETMGALDTLVQQGKVRAIGWCDLTMDQLKECEATRRVDVVQYQFNMIDRRMEQEIIPYCQQQGMAVMVWGPLGSGLLAGTFTEQKNFADGDWRGRGDVPGVTEGMYDQDVWQRNVRLVDDLKLIAKNRSKTMPQLALRWVLSNSAVNVALVGCMNVQELEENMGALDWTLSGEDMRQIDDVFAKHGVETHLPAFVNP